MKRIVFLIGLVLLAVAAYCAGPIQVFNTLHNTPIKDTATFSRLVDHDRVLSHLKPPVGYTAEGYLTPNALSTLTWGAGREAPNWDVNWDSDEEPWPIPTSIGIAQVQLSVSNHQYGLGTTIFTFERKGLNWRLVQIDLPAPKGT